MTTVRVLPPAEWPRLLAYPHFADHGLPDPDHWRILVAESAGAIVGFCCLFDAVHWEAWWIAPTHRRDPLVVGGLIRQGVDLLRDAAVGGVFAVIDEDQTGAVRAMIERFGFKPAPGALYLAAVDELKGVR
jgi:hypothetical protein